MVAQNNLGSEAFVKRFWPKVDIRGEDECWPWLASKKHHGYGGFKVDGRILLAHRVAWILTYGSIPNGMCALHRCDNQGCCNPKHLFLGTKVDNNADRDRKGRNNCAHGEQQGLSKLTEEQVLEIRSRYAAGDISQRKLGGEFGVSQVTIGAITRRRTWTHI